MAFHALLVYYRRHFMPGYKIKRNIQGAEQSILTPCILTLFSSFIYLLSALKYFQ